MEPCQPPDAKPCSKRKSQVEVLLELVASYRAARLTVEASARSAIAALGLFS